MQCHGSSARTRGPARWRGRGRSGSCGFAALPYRRHKSRGLSRTGRSGHRTENPPCRPVVKVVKLMENSDLTISLPGSSDRFSAVRLTWAAASQRSVSRSCVLEFLSCVRSSREAASGSLWGICLWNKRNQLRYFQRFLPGNLFKSLSTFVRCVEINIYDLD